MPWANTMLGLVEDMVGSSARSDSRPKAADHHHRHGVAITAVSTCRLHLPDRVDCSHRPPTAHRRIRMLDVRPGLAWEAWLLSVTLGSEWPRAIAACSRWVGTGTGAAGTGQPRGPPAPRGGWHWEDPAGCSQCDAGT